MKVEYEPGLSVDWTSKEYAKIQEIRRRNGHRPRRKKPELRYLRDLLHYWEYFFHPEIEVSDKMQYKPEYRL